MELYLCSLNVWDFGIVRVVLVVGMYLMVGNLLFFVFGSIKVIV